MKRRALLSFFALAIAGCGDSKPSSSSSSSSSSAGAPSSSASGAASSAPAEKPGDTLTIFVWSEFVPEKVIDGFTKETGIKVLSENFASNEEMLSKMLAGGTTYDIVQPSEYTVEALAKQNMLAPLDPKLVPNAKNIDPAFRGLAHDPELKLCMPYMGSIVGIVVNTQKVKDPIKGYKDVFTAAHKNKIVVVNDSREMVAWALATLKIGPNDITTDTLGKVKPVLTDWTKLIKVYDSDSPKTPLLNGDVDIGVIWSGEAAKLYEQDKKFEFVVPEEGAHFSIDSMCVPANAKNKVGAQMFINYLLRPEVSKLISDEFPYYNPNIEARKLLTDAQRANPASYPKGFFEKDTKRETFRDIGKMSSDIDKLVTDVKAGN